MRLQWLGLPTIELQVGPVKLETRWGQALLAYISTVRQRQQREVVATIFWPGADQHRALGSLRCTLSALYSKLPAWMEAGRETISLMKSSRLWIDVVEFGKLLARVREHCGPGHELCDECRRAAE